jgi:hypothetical protein
MVIFEMIFDETLAGQGVQAISLVERPAIESNFITLSDAIIPIKLAADKERRVVMGAVLIPAKPILRRDPKTDEEFYIFFSNTTIQNVAEHYLLRGLQSSSTIEHEKSAKGVTLVESWLVVDAEKDKSAFYELDVPVGTWMAALKITDENLWKEYIETGDLKGFSIEGYFGMEMREQIVNASRIEKKDAKTLGQMIEEMSEKFNTK